VARSSQRQVIITIIARSSLTLLRRPVPARSMTWIGNPRIDKLGLMNTLPIRQSRRSRHKLPRTRKRSRSNLLCLNRIILAAPLKGEAVVVVAAVISVVAAVTPNLTEEAAEVIVEKTETSSIVPKSGDCID